MAKVKDGIDLVSAIEAAGEADLTAIDERITSLRSEIDEYISTRKRKLDALVLVRKSLQFKLHGRPARQVGNGKKAKGGASEFAQRIYDLLAERGSMPVPAIAAALNVSPQGVGAATTRSSWFERRNGEVAIAVKS